MARVNFSFAPASQTTVLAGNGLKKLYYGADLTRWPAFKCRPSIAKNTSTEERRKSFPLLQVIQKCGIRDRIRGYATATNRKNCQYWEGDWYRNQE